MVCVLKIAVVVEEEKEVMVLSGERIERNIQMYMLMDGWKEEG